MKKIISIFLICALLLCSCGNNVDTKSEITSKSVDIEVIKKKDFYEEINLIGKVSPLVETSVSPQISGVIKSINVSVGQYVQTGEVLASIDLASSVVGVSYENANKAYDNSLNAYSFTQESIKGDLESAKVQLANAKKSRENTYVTTEKQLQLAQIQLDNIKKTQINTTITTGEAIKSAQIGYDLAKQSLDNAKTNIINFEKTSSESLKSINEKRQGLYNTTKVTIENSLIVVYSAITQADKLLGISDKYKNYNDGYEFYLGAKDPKSKIDSESIFAKAQKLYDQISISKNLETENNIDITLANTIDLINIIASLYDKLVYLLDNSITSSTFTQAQLDAIKGSATLGGIVGLQNSVAQLKSSLVSLSNSLDDINNTLSSTQTTIDTTKISLENAKNIAQSQADNASQNLVNLKSSNTSTLDNISGNETLIKTQLENTIATVKGARDNVDNALKIAQSQYDSAKAKLNASGVQSKSQVDSAKSGKDIASIQLNNTSITSPFAGIVMSKNIEIGSTVSPAVSAFTIGDNTGLKVKLEVSSENISNLKLGQSVKIQKNTETFSGTISLLSPAADPQNRLFKVEVSFIGKPTNFNIGDYVDIYIKKGIKNNKVIILPFSALLNLGQGDYNVFVVKDDNTVESRFVKIGGQNSDSVEITSGLKEGEKVVIGGTLSIQAGDSVKEN